MHFSYCNLNFITSTNSCCRIVYAKQCGIQINHTFNLDCLDFFQISIFQERCLKSMNLVEYSDILFKFFFKENKNSTSFNYENLFHSVGLRSISHSSMLVLYIIVSIFLISVVLFLIFLLSYIVLCIHCNRRYEIELRTGFKSTSV